jgi:uncharacterized protein YdaT
LKKGALNVNSSSKVSSLTGDSESDTNINYNNVTTSKDDDSQSATSNDSTATTDSRSNASNSSAASKSSIDSSSMEKKRRMLPKKQRPSKATSNRSLNVIVKMRLAAQKVQPMHIRET